MGLWKSKSQCHEKLTMQFVGVKKVKITTIGPLRHSKREFRTNWLKKIEQLGVHNK